MAVKMAKTKQEEFAFDGDSDSDEDIQGFNQQVKKLHPNVEDEDGDSGSDEDEEDGDEMDGDTDSEVSEDEEAKEKTLKAHVEKQNQISKLHDQLSKLDEEQSDESDSEDNEDSEEEADEDSDDDEDSDADEESNVDRKNITENKPKKHAKKRKNVGDEYEEDAKKVKNNNAEEEMDERQKFKDELSKLSIEEIQKMKEKIGLKLFNQSLGVSKPAFRAKADFKRENKNRPREMSSKKTVPRFREVVSVAKVEAKRDPRFDPLCGEFDEKIFRDSYKFVSNIKNDELNQLKQLGEEEDPERKEKIKFLITRMKNQQRQEKKNEEKIEEKKIETQKTKELLMAGKKPFIMGKAKQKEFDLAAKYEKLKESGGLDSYIKKKTKKNATKDRKKLEQLQ